jgi:hypothetical protein
MDHQVEVPQAFLLSEVQAAFERVWDLFVGLPRDESLLATAELEAPPMNSVWCGSVAWIGGSWTGNVRLAMEPELAVTLTQQLLECNNPDQAQVEDALRELANMVAGNLKSALPGICGLATPGNFKVRSYEDLRDGFSCLVSLWYQSRGRWVVLTLNALDAAS